MSTVSNAVAPIRTSIDQNKWLRVGLYLLLLAFVVAFPLFFPETDAKVDVATTALAYVVMALGLNIVVGFAGLLDLGYVAFYALGALTVGWLGSAFVYGANHSKGIHILVSGPLKNAQGIAPVDPVNFGVGTPFNQLNLRPWYWTILAMVLLVLFVNFRLRDSRQGRAWIAIREDEVAAASMGVPLVKTKLLAYATGAAFGGMSGAFLASYTNTVNADQFQFAFSIFILSMIILGGLGSIWGVVLGAILLQLVNRYLIPDVLNDKAQSWFHFDLTQLSFSIFGFILVLVMLIRPEGLLPERRRKMELREGIGTGETELIEVKA